MLDGERLRVVQHADAGLDEREFLAQVPVANRPLDNLVGGADLGRQAQRRRIA